MKKLAVQDQFGPSGVCFGCGPKNSKGLQIKSYWEGDEFVLRYQPAEHHQAFQGTVNGGIIGTLFDCHANWCAASSLYKILPSEAFPSTVTVEFSVKLKRPTPMNTELVIRAKTIDIAENKVTVEARMWANEKITATFWGVFLAVKEGHPAFHRWD